MLLPSGLHSSQDGSDIVVDRPSITTTLWNDGIHIVDTVRYMSGSEVVSIDNGVERVAGDSTNVYTARCGAPSSGSSAPLPSSVALSLSLSVSRCPGSRAPVPSSFLSVSLRAQSLRQLAELMIIPLW